MIFSDSHLIRKFSEAPTKEREGLELEKTYSTTPIFKTLEEAKNEMDVIASYEKWPYFEVVQTIDHIRQLTFVAHEQLMGEIPKNLMYLISIPNNTKPKAFEKLQGSKICGPFKNVTDRHAKKEELWIDKRMTPIEISGEELGMMYLSAADELLNPSKF